MSDKFPKIAFIGAVTFEELTGSHILFYRLFKHYPPDKLLVIGSNRSRGENVAPKRLPDVKYYIIEDHIPAPKMNYPTSKYALVRFYQDHWNYRRFYQYYQRPIEKEIEDFQPDIILSLTMDIYLSLIHI